MRRPDSASRHKYMNAARPRKAKMKRREEKRKRRGGKKELELELCFFDDRVES